MSSLSPNSLVSISSLPENVGFATFFWHIYKTGQFVDVKFKLSESETFLAHKLILSVWSPLFADKFYGNNENTATGTDTVKLVDKDAVTGITTVELNNINPVAFVSILKFMYGYLGVAEILNRQNALDMLKISMSLDIPHLTRSCHEFMNSITLEVSNVFDVLEAAIDLENRSLTDRCLRFLQDNTRKVLDSYDICKISPSIVHILLDLPRMQMPNEFELLLWMFAWGKNRFLENSNYGSVRDALEEFLPKMPFLSLSNAEFTKLYKEHDDFFTKDEALSIFMNIGILGSAVLPDWYNQELPVREYSGPEE